MNPREFTTAIARIHQYRLAKILHMSPTSGIDLLDDKCGIELKCRMNKYANRVAIHNDQLREYERVHRDVELLYGLVYYDMALEPRRISFRDIRQIERMILNTKVVLLPVTEVLQRPVSACPTADYRYLSSQHAIAPVQKFVRGGITLYVPKQSVLIDRLK